ncbi:MAG: HAMP domain-containing protein, partial [Planctomycetota bacterium]
MILLKRALTQWSITTKLAVLFFLFGFTPMAIVGWIAYNASVKIEDTVGTRFQYVAETIADKIDRNLFERYGDVQAFGLNQVLDQKAVWYRTEVPANPIIQAINQYVDTYDLYSLSMLVDLEGRVIAVNSADADGKPIHSQDLYKKNYREAPWFRALQARQFTTTMPFSSAGNTSATGTFIEDVHIDPDVKAAYPGDDGLTLGFSAPVYRGGEVVAYWTNRAKFAVVEDIIKSASHELKAAGLADVEFTLLDKDGKVLVDYDPATTGTDQVRHDFTVLMALNLSERGVTAAKAAVAGKTGYENARHARKGILQAVGYTHLKGALGYPGMNWSVLVRVNHDHAAADAQAINRNVLITMGVCLAFILPIGMVVGRIGAGGIRQVSDAAAKLAAGALDTRVAVRSADEIGQLGQAFNDMGEKLQANVTKEREQAAKME